jgi:hypothetical protein
MLTVRWPTWRRDLLVSLLASGVTASVLAPIGWAALRQEQTEKAHLVSHLEARFLQARDQVQRRLVEQAAKAYLDFSGGGDLTETEVFQVTTDAIAPEVPNGAHLLIDKKATTYVVGDLVVFRDGGNNYLGRVVEADLAHLTVGRNGQENRRVAISSVVGRGVLNTR